MTIRRLVRVALVAVMAAVSLTSVPAAQAAATQSVSGTVLHPATTGAAARNAWLASGGLVNGVSGYVFEVEPATVGERFIMRSPDTLASRWTDLNITFYDLVGGAYSACQIYDFLNPYEAGRVCGDLGIVWSFSGGPAEFTYEAGQGVTYGGVVEQSGPISHGGRVDFTTGTDLAFEGDYAYVGSEDPDPAEGGLHIIDISDSTNPVKVGHLACPAMQNDVAVWRGIVTMAIDSPSSNAPCAPVGAEGARIVDARDPAHPVQIAFFEKPAGLDVPGVVSAGGGGAHTVTTVGDTGYVYLNNYTAGNVTVVDLRPALTGGDPVVVGQINNGPGGQSGCHDITIDGGRAYCAAITHTEIWDIADPKAPVVLGTIANPAIDIHHSTAASGNVLVIGDEFTGAEAAMGCQLGGPGPAGALWFYDISTPALPVPLGYYNTPQIYPGVRYTAHNFNIIPGTTYLVAAWYKAGVQVVDFADPAKPKQVAHAIGDGAVTWSAYWYRDAIITGDLHRGTDIFHLDLPGVPKPGGSTGV